LLPFTGDGLYLSKKEAKWRGVGDQEKRGAVRRNTAGRFIEWEMRRKDKEVDVTRSSFGRKGGRTVMALGGGLVVGGGASFCPGGERFGATVEGKPFWERVPEGGKCPMLFLS